MTRIYLSFFLVALFGSYAAEWGPYYISLMTGGRLEVVGSIKQRAEPCGDAPRGDVVCKVAYRFPKAYLDKMAGEDGAGLGIILHATEIGCADAFTPKARFGRVETAGKDIDYQNVYQTFRKSVLDCTTGDALIKAWSPAGTNRYGYMGGQAVVGSSTDVMRTRKFVEFFRSSFLVIAAALLMLVYAFNNVLTGMIKIDTQPSALEKYYFSWIAYSALISGLFGLLLPFNADSTLFSRIAAFFRLMICSGVVIYAISRSGRVPEKLSRVCGYLAGSRGLPFGLHWTHVLMAVIVLVPAFRAFHVRINVVMAFIMLLLGVLHRSPMYFFFGLAGILPALSIYKLMSQYLPDSRVLLLYAIGCLIWEFVARIRKSARVSDSVRWVRGIIEGCGRGEITVQGALREFAARFGVGQISLATARPGGGCDITINRSDGGKWVTESFMRDVLPPMVSHVMTMRDPLWHLDEGSLFAINLRKGQLRVQDYGSKLFSVVPLMTEATAIAAVSFTRYDEKYATDPFMKLELATVTGHLLPLLAREISRHELALMEDWDRSCQGLSEKIASYRQSVAEKGFESCAQEVMDGVHAALGVSGYIGRLDPVSRKIQLVAIAGYDEELRAHYRATQFYALQHNEQGPMVLAVNRGKIITVGDMNLLHGVLQAKSLKILEKSGTRSCAAVPVMRSEVWGVLWIVSKEVGKFSARSEPGLRMIGGAIENLLGFEEMAEASEKALAALEGFIPKDVMSRVLEGRSVREEEAGYLLMADLMDSTRLSRVVGTDKWSEFVKGMVPFVEEVAGRFGFRLQLVVWDAFFLTLGAARQRYSDVTRAFDLSTRLNAAFSGEIAKQFDAADAGDYSQRARFCLTYGDITRDVRMSHTKSWTIVGGAMSAVNKLEQACKGRRGIIFVSRVAFDDEPGPVWTEIDTQVSGIGERVYSR